MKCWNCDGQKQTLLESGRDYMRYGKCETCDGAGSLPDTPPAASAADHVRALQECQFVAAATHDGLREFSDSADSNIARCYLALTAQLARAEAEKEQITTAKDAWIAQLTTALTGANERGKEAERKLREAEERIAALMAHKSMPSMTAVGDDG